MGWAERSNPNSEWNKKRAGNIVHVASSKIASPISNNQISNNQNIVKVSTPVRPDEPMVIQITTKSVFMLFKELLWRMLKTLIPNQKPPQSPALTS